MNARKRSDLSRLVMIGLIVPMTAMGIAFSASAQTRPGQPASNTENVVRVLGSRSTRFSPPLPNVDAVRRMASDPKNQRDLGAVLEMAGLVTVRAAVIQVLTSGNVTETM